MKIILGIDVGGSTTKIVGFSKEKGCVGKLQVKAADQITSLYGAIGNFLQKYDIGLCDVENIILTGVGASFVDDDIYNIPTEKIDEFQAIGYGGLYLSGLKEAFIASMGTGTAFVRATEQEIVHIGGSGIGGGTLIGLSAVMLGKSDIEAVLMLAKDGRLFNVDLSVSEILNRDIPSLPANLTAANFGKISSMATTEDFAIGIINMVFQTIGVMAALATRNDNIKDIVLTGTLTTIPQASEIFDAIAKIYGISFIIPNDAVFATAIGAAVSNLCKE